LTKKGKGCACKGGSKAAMAKAMSPKTSGASFPTLGDLKKTIPPGGLLNPGLRKGFSVGAPKGR